MSFAAHVRLRECFLLTHRVSIMQAELIAFDTAKNSGEVHGPRDMECSA